VNAMRCLVACLCLTLAACAGFQSIDPGKPVDVGDEVSVDSQVQWAKFTGTNSGTLWTIDGFGLDELRFFNGIKSGDPLMQIPGVNRKDMVTYNMTMLPNDVMDLVTSTLGKAGYQQVRSTGLRPAPFGTAAGFRFDLSFATKEGLQMKGAALIAQRRGKLDVVLYLAPAEFYYERYAPTVDRIFSSIRVPDAPAAGPPIS
jgi:hypothetical protein